jgi:anti-sigma B factor antagonist
VCCTPRYARRGPTYGSAPAGEIDVCTSHQLEKAIDDGLTIRLDRIDLDLHLVSFIDSFGLTVLAKSHQLADRPGCWLIVRSPTRQVDRSLALGGLDQYLHIET